MRIGDLMTREVLTTRPERPALEARSEMRQHGIHHLVVVEDNGVVGILSDRDRASSSSDRVRDVMSEPVVTVTSETSIQEAASLLRGHSIGCLPVIDRGRCVGIVTTADLLDWIALGRASA